LIRTLVRVVFLLCGSRCSRRNPSKFFVITATITPVARSGMLLHRCSSSLTSFVCLLAVFPFNPRSFYLLFPFFDLLSAPSHRISFSNPPVCLVSGTRLPHTIERTRLRTQNLSMRPVRQLRNHVATCLHHTSCAFISLALILTGLIGLIPHSVVTIQMFRTTSIRSGILR
jgi:hypothetical protein